jgi:hypothetical protein
MADFDERAIRSPGQPVDSIRTDDLSPWMVWSAAGAIAGLGLLGLVFGARGGHPASDVGLALTRGEALNPATAASASAAVGLPKDQQWSTLSGPEILPKSAAAPRTAAADEADSGDEASAEPAAAAAVAVQTEPAPTVITPVEPQSPAPAPPTSEPPAGPTTP